MADIRLKNGAFADDAFVDKIIETLRPIASSCHAGDVLELVCLIRMAKDETFIPLWDIEYTPRAVSELDDPRWPQSLHVEVIRKANKEQKEKLIGMGLLNEDGEMDNRVRNIIISALQDWPSGKFGLGNPVAEPTPPGPTPGGP